MANAMKGLVYDIKRYAVHDGPGLRSTVFFKGCPMRCWWCHNPESQRLEPEMVEQEKRLGQQSFTEKKTIGRWMSVSDVMKEVEKERIFFDESNGGVTFSGGEPLMQPEFLEELLKACRRQDIHSAVDTCGYASGSSVERILPWTDLVLFDLKHMDGAAHKKYTGVDNAVVLRNLERILEFGMEVIIRIPLIPDVNDKKENLEAIVGFLKPLAPVKRIDIMPYHSIAAHKYRRFEMDNKMDGVKEPAVEKVNACKAVFEAAGFHVKIEG